MKDLRFEARLAAARPKNYKIRKDFTDRVMKGIGSLEILSARVRNMSVNKKETFMQRLRHLPKIAIIGIAVGALLVLSAGAYATYQLLWPKPEVQVSEPQTSVSGREEFEITFAQCGDTSLAQRYELKKSAPITAEDVPKVVQAHCELDAIGAWAKNTFPNTNPDPTQGGERIMLNPAMPTHINEMTSDSVTFAGLTKYNQVDKTLSIDKNVRYIVDGREAEKDEIKVGDSVVYITSSVERLTPNADCNAMHCSVSSEQVSNRLVAIVKLSMPFEYYDQLAWQSLAERNECQGNPNDTCLSGHVSAVDLYYGNAIINDLNTERMKEIQGVVTALNGTSTVIRSSSGTLFTIVTPTDVIASYNRGPAQQYYNGMIVKIGSTLRVSYVEAISDSNKTIMADQLSSFMLQGEIISKGDPIKAY